MLIELLLVLLFLCWFKRKKITLKRGNIVGSGVGQDPCGSLKTQDLVIPDRNSLTCQNKQPNNPFICFRFTRGWFFFLNFKSEHIENKICQAGWECSISKAVNQGGLTIPPAWFPHYANGTWNFGWKREELLSAVPTQGFHWIWASTFPSCCWHKHRVVPGPLMFKGRRQRQTPQLGECCSASLFMQEIRFWRICLGSGPLVWDLIPTAHLCTQRRSGDHEGAGRLNWNFSDLWEPLPHLKPPCSFSWRENPSFFLS